MSYDDWRQETDRDYEDRMHVHDRGTPFTYPPSGVCACGVETTRAVSQKGGHRWECKDCAEANLRAIYDRASRKVG
jgi:hypothetical protein